MSFAVLASLWFRGGGGAFPPPRESLPRTGYYLSGTATCRGAGERLSAVPVRTVNYTSTQSTRFIRVSRGLHQRFRFEPLLAQQLNVLKFVVNRRWIQRRRDFSRGESV